MDYRTDHVERAMGRILTQYKDKPRIREITSICVEPFQEIEDAQKQIREARDPATATGESLTGVAANVGAIRSGFDDTNLRKVVYATIAANWSDGRESDLSSLLQAFYGPGASLTYTEIGKAHSIYHLTDYPLAFEPRYVAGLLTKAKTAGTRVFFHYLTDTTANTFTLSSSSSALQTSATLGLANASQTTGGKLAGVEAA